MMWLVRLALRRPISVAVMALLTLVHGTLSFFLMNIDIFPAINVPVVMVVWNYPGIASLDMERRMVFISERAYSLNRRDRQFSPRSNSWSRSAESLFPSGRCSSRTRQRHRRRRVR